MFKSKVINTVSRAAKLTQVARAARHATRGDQTDRAIAKRALVNLLADVRGVPMKIGQLFATLSDDPAFQDLVDGIPPRPLTEMIPVLKAAIGQPITNVFASIDESDMAASLGQVHHAVLLDGTEVAVKIRYPDICHAVDAEMRLAGLIPNAGPAKKWGFDLGSYKTALKRNMDRELNYQDEARRQKRFRQTTQVTGLTVPDVHDRLSTQSVLVQSWETGHRLHDVRHWAHQDRLAIGKTLMATLFRSLFIGGEVHGDPHTGNLLFRRTTAGPEVVLLDFGCTVPVQDQARWSLLKLIVGCHDRDETDPLRCLAAMGFDTTKLLSISHALPAMCQLLLEPFCQDDSFSTQYWRIGKRSDALLGELRWWFRSAGPAELILLMRAFHGLVNQLEKLKVVLPWWQVLVDTLGQSALDQAKAFTPPPIPAGLVQSHRTFKGVARFIKIRVVEGSRQIVALTMPSSQVPFLQDQIPDNVLKKIDDSGIDLQGIIRRTCEGGIVPGELFALKSGNRHYRVWLE